jgi:hypothetical protein
VGVVGDRVASRLELRDPERGVTLALRNEGPVTDPGFLDEFDDVGAI